MSKQSCSLSRIRKPDCCAKRQGLRSCIAFTVPTQCAHQDDRGREVVYLDQVVGEGCQTSYQSWRSEKVVDDLCLDPTEPKRAPRGTVHLSKLSPGCSKNQDLFSKQNHLKRVSISTITEFPIYFEKRLGESDFWLSRDRDN